MKDVWPAILVTGVSFAIPQFVISNYVNPWIVDIGASLISMGALILFLRVWQPRQLWLSPALRGHDESAATMATAKPIDKTPLTQGELFSALLPWIIVCVVMLIWGNGGFKTWANSIFVWNYPVPELHQMINKMPPVAPGPTKEAAVFGFTYLSFTGSGMLIAAIISGVLMGVGPVRLLVEYGRTIRLCAISLITISAMLAIGTLTRLSGVDATLGLAFAATGVLYPFFGTLLGWLGVALTGSDTSSNILFGNLQKITSQQLGLSPILMGAANSSGGVMGKMIDAQSIVVASTATNWYGHEGTILRFVFWHSIVLACLVGVLVTGPSGSGKSTLFRAIAGIWPFGTGTIDIPAQAKLMMLPQRPYFPVGALGDAVIYPSAPGAFQAARIRDAVIAVGLPDLAERLGEDGHWNRMLSLGEQQRLGLARALLHMPDYLFLDEATASLDEPSEARLYRLLTEKLPQATIVSIGHRSTLDAFHTRKVTMVKNGMIHVLADGEAPAEPERSVAR